MIRFHSSTRFLFLTLLALAMGPSAALAQNWQGAANTGLKGTTTSLAIAANGDIFAGTENALFSYTGVYRSTDNGNSWALMNNSTSEAALGPVYGINFKGVNPNGDVFVGGSYEYRSTDNGNSWVQIRNSGDPQDYPVLAFAAILPGINGRLFFATGSTGLLYSDDNGTTWTEGGDMLGGSHPTYIASTPLGSIFEASASEIERGTGSNGDFFGLLASAPTLGNGITFASNDSGMIVAGGTGGLFITTDNGNDWTTITPSGANSTTSYALAIGTNGNIFEAMNSGGISLSTDSGKDWNDVSSGLTSTTVNALAINRDGILFAATKNGLFQYQTPTGGVKSGGSDIPSLLTLEQNTPNPVTSSTTIHFTVPESGPISLRVFDPTGRTVATVAGGYYAPGSYDVSFDARGLPDGPYFYRIESGEASSARMFVIER